MTILQTTPTANPIYMCVSGGVVMLQLMHHLLTPSATFNSSGVGYVVLCEEGLQLCHIKVPHIEETVSRMVGVETSFLA